MRSLKSNGTDGSQESDEFARMLQSPRAPLTGAQPNAAGFTVF
jgi:hypothetical protein